MDPYRTCLEYIHAFVSGAIAEAVRSGVSRDSVDAAVRTISLTTKDVPRPVYTTSIMVIFLWMIKSDMDKIDNDDRSGMS